MAELIDLDKIDFKESPAVRASDDEETIVEYYTRRSEGSEAPAIDLFWIDDLNSYVIADGRKRFCAYQRNNDEQILAKVHRGGMRAATEFALGANADHGLRLSKADIKASLKIILDDSEWRNWSNGKIAKKLGVSEATVRRARKSFEPDISDDHATSTKDEVDENSTETAEKTANAPRKKPVQEPTKRVGLDGKERALPKTPVAKADPRPGGKEAIKPEYRREAKAAFGSFVRSINRVPGWKSLLEPHLEQIAELMRERWGRGGKK